MRANPIRDQKVFVRLDKVLELQKEYLRADQNSRTNNLPNVERKARLDAIEQTLKWVIETLELPIT